MPAPKGNEFWKARSTHGHAPIFASAELLWNACCEYFEWVEENPLWESRAFAYQGEVTIEKVPKMRAMTLSGLCIFLDIGRRTWDDYAGREDYSLVTTRVEEMIYMQKLQGAAADLLNANIIARELGLRDKQDVEQKTTLSADNSVMALMKAIDGRTRTK